MEHESQVRKSLLKNKPFLFSAAVIVLFVVIIAYLVYNPSSADNPANSTLQIGNSPVLGDNNAPVTIYEFSDFSCPFCAAAEGKNEEVLNYLKQRMPEWEAPLPLIKEQYVSSGKVKIVFKYFPGHGAALAAHAVALGLNEQNPELFWKFAERAFNQDENLNDLSRMKAIAKELGADESKLADYIESDKYLAQLQEDADMGTENGVQGTPTFFINGKLVSGAQSFPVFKDIIDEELS